MCVSIPLEQGRFFNTGANFAKTPFMCRNPFGAGTVFQCYVDLTEVMSAVSQSLWSRDGFSIKAMRIAPKIPKVAIPLEQGRFFNFGDIVEKKRLFVAIPLEQGRFFNKTVYRTIDLIVRRNPIGAGTVFQLNPLTLRGSRGESQSLWSRDGFSIYLSMVWQLLSSRNPFGAGTVFQWRTLNAVTWT